MAEPTESGKRPARFVAYPLLAAIYSVVALAAANGGELIRPVDLLLPLVISVTAAIAAWFISRAATRNLDGRALLTFILVTVFSGHGYLVDALDQWGVPRPLAAASLALVPVALAVVVVRRGRVSFRPLSTYLNLVLAIMLAWASATLLWHWVRSPDPGIALPDLPDRPNAAAPMAVRDRPNVLLIILDKYAGRQSLLSDFDYDNRPFEMMLEHQGFFVPRAPRSNYVNTFLTLASMLNWEYLDDVARRAKHDGSRWGPAASLIEDNRTWRALHRLGYRFVFMPTAYQPTSRNRFADVQIPDPRQLTHEFEVVWFRGTIMLGLMQRVCGAVPCSGASPPYVPESAASLDWKFATIPTLLQGDRPVFLFAHLLVPHEPYVYDANCGHRPPYWPTTDEGREAAAVTAAYIGQIQCVNRKVETLVREVLADSTRPSLIILQADHGHGRLGRDLPMLSAATPRQVDARSDIFAAYRLPGAPPGLMSDSVGPVNAMRAVMRYYFGLDLPALQEATYWSSGSRPYDLTRVR